MGQSDPRTRHRGVKGSMRAHGAGTASHEAHMRLARHQLRGGSACLQQLTVLECLHLRRAKMHRLPGCGGGSSAVRARIALNSSKDRVPAAGFGGPRGDAPP